ncbi:glucosaminidase domain-containing protein [Macrococcus animalis]|uniref:glucosaminidase domain-containing protein n=1 Tax=Macrococcus animalis TaxID=3395467 RepID=UPI0039BE7881
MDNKFYYKTPALMLMMFAGTTTAAYAAEQEEVKPQTIEKTDNDATNNEVTNETSTESKTQSLNVIAKNDLSNPKSITEQYSLSQVKNNINPESNAIPTTEVPSTETKSVETTTEAPATEDNSVETATEVPSTETKSVETTTKAPATEDKSVETATDAPSTETKSVETATEAPSTEDNSLETVTEAPSTETKSVETATDVPSTETKSVETATDVPSTEDKSVETATVVPSPETKSVEITTEVPSEDKSVEATAKKKSILNTARVRTLGSSTKSKNIDTMSVNEVIKYNNWSVPVYEKSFFDSPKIAYRNGVAKPEGIVAHETANPTSKIDGEIAYMKRNYNNAFVHAFIDDQRIVEVADTDYISWGAGPAANPRYINVELVRVHGKEAFSRSINNYADYFATNLLYYGLPLDNAHYDGNGTVWNHKAVSNFLGGTDHTDPIGWFQQNNYTFDDFYNLVSEKYNYKLNGTVPVTPAPAPGNTPPKVTPSPSNGVVTTKNINKIGKIKSRSALVLSSVTNNSGNQAGTKAFNAFYINKQAVKDGITYYSLIDNNNTPRGWVKSSDMITQTLSKETKINKSFIVNNKATKLLTTPWGSSKQVVRSLKPSIGKTFNSSKKIKVGNVDYYFGTVNALTGWVNLNHITLKTKAKAPIKITDMKNVSLIGRTDAKNAVLYTNIQSTKKAKTKPVDMQLYINKEAKKNNTKYYSVADPKNKFLGWISDTFIKEKPYKTVSWTKVPYTVKKTTGYIYSIPGGSRAQRVKKLSDLPSKTVQVIRTDKVGNALWHKVLLEDNTTGYVPDSYLFSQNIVKLKAPESLDVAVAKQSRLKNYERNTGPKVVFSTPKRAYNERLAKDYEIKANMDTKNALNDAELKYQFLDLGQAEGISAKQLNKLLVGKGVLENQGAAFAAAAKQLKINEIYLIAHAFLETGNGTSRLSNGLGISNDNKKIIDNASKKYYNMFGTKATDNNVELGGIAYAKQNGWDSASKAIIGGAKYVREAYIDKGQRTLHQMRWNPENTATHQYATDVRWAQKNATTIARLYKTLGLDGLNYIVHEYI